MKQSTTPSRFTTFLLLNIIITSFIRVSKSYSAPTRSLLAQQWGISHHNKKTSIIASATRFTRSDKSSKMRLSTSSDQCSIGRSTGLATFLHSNKNRIQSWSNNYNNKNNNKKNNSQKHERFKIIMGNEAGDADSIISAITLAHVESLHHPDNDNNNDTNNDKDDADHTYEQETLLPIASIARQDIVLRNDVNLLLDMVRIDKDHDLMYLDDDIVQTIVHHHDNDDNHHIQKSLVLVDHNKLRSDLWHLEGYVEEIIDHHQDEGAHSDSVHDDMREIAFEDNGATAGSTCTLIVERLMLYYMHDNDNHTHAVETDRMSIDPGLGLALLGVILLDTMNMSKHAGKGTVRDEKAIDFLMEHVAWESLNLKEPMQSKIFPSDSKNENRCIPNREQLFNVLQNSKFDSDFWKDMSARDALRIDYKRFETSPSNTNAFGLSSVLLGMEDLISKPNFSQAAISYMQEANVNLLGVLTMVIQNDQPVRELLLIGDRQTVERMTSYLLHNDNASILDMKADSDVSSPTEIIDEDVVMMKLKQGNSKGSRKQVAPIMMSYF